MARKVSARLLLPRRLSPHARGWPGAGGSRCSGAAGFSPHARGWPGDGACFLWTLTSSPRTRGDGPQLRYGTRCLTPFSPHARGWPDPRMWPAITTGRSPRTRGDGPQYPSQLVEGLEFSPHARGWPEQWEFERGPTIVLPARAGMARSAPTATAQQLGFSPHARGWPAAARSLIAVISRSPRTRGDGPVSQREAAAANHVLPARAGMARHPY